MERLQRFGRAEAYVTIDWVLREPAGYVTGEIQQYEALCETETGANGSAYKTLNWTHDSPKMAALTLRILFLASFDWNRVLTYARIHPPRAFCGHETFCRWCVDTHMLARVCLLMRTSANQRNSWELVATWASSWTPFLFGGPENNPCLWSVKHQVVQNNNNNKKTPPSYFIMIGH